MVGAVRRCVMNDHATPTLAKLLLKEYKIMALEQRSGERC